MTLSKILCSTLLWLALPACSGQAGQIVEGCSVATGLELANDVAAAVQIGSYDSMAAALAALAKQHSLQLVRCAVTGMLDQAAPPAPAADGGVPIAAMQFPAPPEQTERMQRWVSETKP